VPRLRKPVTRIAVATGNEAAARELFCAAGFTDFVVEPRNAAAVTFVFEGVRNEDKHRLFAAIPHEMNFNQGFVVGPLPIHSEADANIAADGLRKIAQTLTDNPSATPETVSNALRELRQKLADRDGGEQ
jgi:hypothetical protein